MQSRAAGFPKAILTVLCACATAAPVASALPSAEAVQSLGTIRSVARDFVTSLVPHGSGTPHVEAAQLDPRLRLRACTQELRASLPSGTELRPRTTVAVACEDGAPWRIYVGVGIEADVRVLVLRRAAARGEQLGAADLETQERRVPGLAHAYVTNAQELTGRPLRRALAAGTALTVDALAPGRLVQRGQQVTLLASGGAVQVRAPGIALADAGAAQRVRVQNAASLKVVEGVVESASTVRVSP